MNIDLHAHILPKADHGSDGLETSLKQVALAQAAEIDVLALTPHFYPARDTIEDFLRRREACCAELKANLPKNAPKLLLGAEVHLCRGLENVEHLHSLCYEGTNVLLLELPPQYNPKLLNKTMEELIYERDLQILLAHVDRYDPKLVESLLAQGCLAQINASALCHFWSKRRALRWFEEGHVCALGSDIHGTETGYTEFQTAKKALGPRYRELMSRAEALIFPEDS